MLDPYSLVDGALSPIIPLMMFSDDHPTIGELMSMDLKHKKKGMIRFLLLKFILLRT